MQIYQHYINGEWSDASDGAVLTSINPATEEAWAQVSVATEDDVNRAVAAVLHSARGHFAIEVKHLVALGGLPT